MTIANFARRWQRLPGRAALLLGLGALSAAGAHADTPPPGTGAGDLQLRSEGGRIWLAEGSGELQELALGDTAEARHLKQLIEARGAEPPLRVRPTVLAGGGGMGFSWWSHAKPESAVKADAPVKPDKTPKAGQPAKKDPAGAAKKD